MSRTCWNKSSKSRPTAQHLLGRLQFEVYLQNPGPAREMFIGDRNTIWHSDSPGCESHKGHYCQARLTDDIFWFLCDPGTLIGVSSVELGYTAEEASCPPWPPKFEICADSGISEGCPLSKHYFAVVSMKEACAWVKIFRRSALRVDIHFTSKQYDRSSSTALFATSENESVHQPPDVHIKMPVDKDRELDIQETEGKPPRGSVLAKALAVFVGFRKKLGQLFSAIS